MAKRELSSTLKNLKFMQRAVQREEKCQKEEEVIPDGNFPSSGTIKKCTVIVEGDPHPGAIKGRMSFRSFNPSIDKLNEAATNPRQPEASTACSGNQNGRNSDSTVIVEGDPHPGAIKGRMSFQSFNPSIDKLNEAATNPRQPEASTECSGNQNGRNSDREKWSAQFELENLKLNSSNNDDASGEVKRKQHEVVSETQYPNKSQKNVQGDQESSPNNSSSRRQPKHEKLDWNVLRPSKGQKKR